jgi:periplasmic divalent cation tolerance protein
MSTLVCFCTCPDAASAERPDEVLLLVKTTRARLDALVARLPALHPYELPELIAVEAAGGLPAYLDWVADATRVGD